MIVCADADYRDNETVGAAVGIENWADPAPSLERVVRFKQPQAPYVPGQFYLREMPVILDVLATIAQMQVIVIDGYVWLGKSQRGLGARLYERLDGHYPVIGVAKRPFRDNDCSLAIRRGGSTRPLYVTSIGIDLRTAAEDITQMHGTHRIPTILKRVDQLARDS